MNTVAVLVAELVSSSPNQSPSVDAWIRTRELWGILGRPNWLAVVQIKAPLETPVFKPTNMVVVLVAQLFSSSPNQNPSGDARI